MPAKDLSHLRTLSFNEGMLGFKLGKKGGEYRVGDRLWFYPSVIIDQYEISDSDERIFKHIGYDIYEFTFKAVAKYQQKSETKGYSKFKRYFHYLIEISPGFNVFHFNWTKDGDNYLKLDVLYRGLGRLTTCDNPAAENANVDPKAIKAMRCKGTLEKIRINMIWRNFMTKFASKDLKKDLIYSDKDTISYEDALVSIGYPENYLKFKVTISDLLNDQSSLESTGKKKDSDHLVYCIKMT